MAWAIFIEFVSVKTSMLIMCFTCKPFVNVRKVWGWIFVRNTTRGFAFCPLKLHVCFINTRVALLRILYCRPVSCNIGIYFAYSVIFPLELCCNSIFLDRSLTNDKLFVSVYAPFYFLYNPLSTLPAVRHITSWRKTGKYTRPTT